MQAELLDLFQFSMDVDQFMAILAMVRLCRAPPSWLLCSTVSMPVTLLLLTLCNGYRMAIIYAMSMAEIMVANKDKVRIIERQRASNNKEK